MGHTIVVDTDDEVEVLAIAARCDHAIAAGLLWAYTVAFEGRHLRRRRAPKTWRITIEYR